MIATGPVLTRQHVMTTPYRGLMPYSEDDWPYFFGREHECEVIGANLMASRLTLLYGSSGVGKTSVLRAGVGHQLNDLARESVQSTGEAEHVVVIFSEWRTEPLVGLLGEVARSVAATCGPAAASRTPGDGAGLVEALEWWTDRTGCELLIVLDQFEEYFLYHPHDEPGDFADQLPLAIRRPGLRVNFVISLREDTLARLDRFKGRIPNLFDNYLRLELLERDSARAAIERPIKHYNQARAEQEQVSIEPELVDAVLDQIAAEVEQPRPGDPALAASASTRIDPSYLQVVMDRVWTAETSDGGRVLRREVLTRLGSARQILSTYLDQTMGGLSPGDQDVAAAIFHHLVTPSGMKIAHTVHDLAQYTEQSDEAVQAVVLLLAGDLRILRSVAAPGEFGQSRYEIYHDRLAEAVLGWRARHLQAKRDALAAQKLEEERATAELRLQKAVVAEKQQADERVAFERAAAAQNSRRSILLPLLLVLATWLGALLIGIGAWLVPVALVRWLEKPVTWARALVIGLVWPIIAVPAALLGYLVNSLIYFVGTTMAGQKFEALPYTVVSVTIVAYSVGYGAHALVAGKLTYWLLGERRLTAWLARYRRVLMPAGMALATWLGVFGLIVGTVIAPAVVVHTYEQPLTWRRSFAVGAIWAVVLFLAAALVGGVFEALNVSLALLPAFVYAFVRYVLPPLVAFVALAAVGGYLTSFVLRDAHRTPRVESGGGSADLDRHAPGQTQLGLELEQPVTKLAGNAAER